MVDLDLEYRKFSMNELLNILEKSPCLKSIRIPFVSIEEVKSTLSPVWASNSLERVSLGLYLKGHAPDVYKSSYRFDQQKSPQIGVLSTRAATLLGPSFMEQLNGQSELRDLELSFNNRLRPELSPFLQLSLDPVVGLPQLRNLKKLQKLVISGLAHRLGPERNQVDVPAPAADLVDRSSDFLHKWIGTFKALSSTRNNFSGLVPHYYRWFPQLHFVIPADCYSCDRCFYLSCSCRDLNEACE